MKLRKLTPERVARLNRQDTLKNGNPEDTGWELDRYVLALDGNRGVWIDRRAEDSHAIL